MRRISSIKLLILGIVALLAPALVKGADSTPSYSSFEIKLPRGIPEDLWSYFIPSDNPMTEAKVALGRRLFFDPALSADGTISCASCHDPGRAFTDGKVIAEGIHGRRGTRNSPTLLNAMFNTGQFWDGRAATLEEQAKMPLTNPDEMGNRSLEDITARLSANPEYVKEFAKVFGGGISVDGVAKAIAAFERTLVSGDSPLDRYLAGDLNAMTEQQRSGMFLFRTRARCGICHAFNLNFSAFGTFPFLTDGNYRNTGVAANFGQFDSLARRAMEAARQKSGKGIAELAKHERAGELGRFVISGNGLDIGAFRTPSLRNVAVTAPYFHDGSAATLEDVVRFYMKGGNANPNRDWQLEPVSLTETEQLDLVEFLKALTGQDVQQAVQPAVLVRTAKP